MREDGDNENNSYNLTILLFLAPIIFCAYAWNAQLAPDQVIHLLEAVVWPFTLLVVANFFRPEIARLLNRITGGKLPGGIEFQATQATVEIETARNQDTVNETQEFEGLVNFLVPNTKAALSWFSTQGRAIPTQVFIESFALPNSLPPETDVAAQKLIILGVLNMAGLLDVERSAYSITEKGTRFLRFINYL